MNVENSTPASRGRLRFRLRTLLIVTTFLGTVLGLLSNELLRVRRHRELVQKIESLNGGLRPYGMYLPGSHLSPGYYLRRIFGDEPYSVEDLVSLDSAHDVPLNHDLRILT